MSLRRFFPSTIRSAGGGGYTPITDSSFDSFSFQRFYDPNLVCFRIRNENASAIRDIGWVDDFVDVQDSKDFIALDPSAPFSPLNLNGQKKTTSEIQLSGGAVRYDPDGLDTNKPTANLISGSAIYQFIGTLNKTLAKNTPYFSVTMLVKAEGTISPDAIQPIFYISTHTSTTRVKSAIYIQKNPSDGFAIAGRRLSADSSTSLFISDSANQWRVVTGIFDFENRELILRIDGVQKGISIVFGSGGNSENTDSLVQQVGFTNSFFLMSGITIWNSRPTSFSEVENIENIYKNLAGLI